MQGRRIFCLILILIFGHRAYAQNISINTTGAANSTNSMLEVLQPSGTSNTKGLHITHSGTGTNAYAIWAEATGATNRYAFVVPATGGSVGIGTTSPSARLHVTRGDIGVGRIDGGDDTPYARFGLSNGWEQYLANNAFYNAATGQWNFVNTGGYGGMASMLYQVSGTMQFYTANNGANPVAWSQRMTILNNGNIGISTNNPAERLQVVGKTALSRDGTGECCSGGNYTLSLAENTVGNGNRATIQFHNAGFDEGAIQLTSGGLSVGGNSRRFRMFDNQSVTMGLEITGKLYYGNSQTRTESRDNAGLQGSAGAQSGFFETASPTNYPAGATSWWHLLDVRHSNNGNNYAMQFSGSFFDQNLYFRKTNNNPAQPWFQILTTNSVKAYTAQASQTNINSTSYIDVSGLSITITTSSTCVFIINTAGSLESQGTSGTWSGTITAIDRGGTTITEQGVDIINPSSPAVNYVVHHWAINYAETLPAGTYTYKVKSRRYNGSNFYAGGATTTGLPNDGTMTILVIPQ